MSMSMGFSLEISITIQLQRTVCRIHIDSDNAKVALVDMLINKNCKNFRYQICSKCFNLVGEVDKGDSNYKRRWARSFKKLKHKVYRANEENKVGELSDLEVMLFTVATRTITLFEKWKVATGFDGMWNIRF